jgi:hypothetical protein
VIADVNVLNVGTDGLDDSRTLVTEDHRPRPVQGAIEIVIVAVAQPCGDGPHQNLASYWLVVDDFGDIELVRVVKQYGGTHQA